MRVTMNLVTGYALWLAPEVYTSDMNLWLVLLGGAAALTLLAGVALLGSRSTRRQGLAVSGAAIVFALGNARQA